MNKKDDPLLIDRRSDPDRYVLWTHQAAVPAPKGYVIAEINVTDPEAYKQYLAAVTPVVTYFGGKYIVRAGKLTPLEGDPPTGRVVVVEFESAAVAIAFDESPEYQAIAPLRRRAARGRTFIVEGTPR
jgi:uncharacterized protein (DUF1330 family)